MESIRVTVHRGEEPKLPDTLRFVVISDTHARIGTDFSLPEGDILIHCGDFSMKGSTEELRAFISSLSHWQFRHKIVIAGNHDYTFDPHFCSTSHSHSLHYNEGIKRELARYCTYLEDSGVELYGYRLWGTPWVPKHTKTAFSLPEGSPDLRAKRDLIPSNTDILITHGPVYGFNDLTADNKSAGCLLLLEALQRVRPLIHLCGHIHEGHGVAETRYCPSVNASICAKKYQPVHKAYVFDLPRSRS